MESEETAAARPLLRIGRLFFVVELICSMVISFLE
jgi:hypothetical protein